MGAQPCHQDRPANGQDGGALGSGSLAKQSHYSRRSADTPAEEEESRCPVCNELDKDSDRHPMAVWVATRTRLTVRWFAHRRTVGERPDRSLPMRRKPSGILLPTK